MKFIPKLFMTEMVQAIQEGRKTVTRRPMKPQPIVFNEHFPLPIPVNEMSKQLKQFAKKGYTQIYTSGPLSGKMGPALPAAPGDIIWVRETWAKSTDIPGFEPISGCEDYSDLFIYRADFNNEPVDWNWKPSLFMPKEACRFFLRVKDCSWQRLEEITTNEYWKEGLDTELDYEDGILDLERKWVELWCGMYHEYSPGQWVSRTEFEEIGPDELPAIREQFLNDKTVKI
jgi:hypothetical protein